MVPIGMLNVICSLILAIIVIVFVASDRNNLFNKSKKNKFVGVLKENYMLLISLLLFVLYFIFPISLGGETWYMNSRVLPFFFAFVFLTKKKQGLLVMTFSALIAILVVVNLFGAFSSFNAEISSFNEGISYVHENSTITYLYLANRTSINYLEHAWAYYAMATNSVSAESFAFTDFSPITYRNPLPRPSSEEYYGMKLPSQAFFTNFDYVIVWLEDSKNYSLYNYVAVYQNSNLVVFKTS